MEKDKRKLLEQLNLLNPDVQAGIAKEHALKIKS